MIEVGSHWATVAQNASAAMERASQELSDLQDLAQQAQCEMRDLLSEKAAAQQRRDDLTATTASAKADLDKARLAEELSAGTPLEAAAHEATEQSSRLWSAAHEDMQTHDRASVTRGQEIEQRLAFLQKSLDEAAEMDEGLRAKMTTLREVYDSAHSDHGKDEQARIETEFTGVAERRAAIVRQLDEIDQEEAALRATLPERLKDWPALARETLAAHLVDYQPGPLHQALTDWEHAARLMGDHSKTVDWNLWRAHVGNLPAWHLVEYGPREKYIHRPAKQIDEPLRMYEQMLDNLASTLARLESQERERQVTARMQGL